MADSRCARRSVLPSHKRQRNPTCHESHSTDRCSFADTSIFCQCHAVAGATKQSHAHGQQRPCYVCHAHVSPSTDGRRRHQQNRVQQVKSGSRFKRLAVRFFAGFQSMRAKSTGTNGCASRQTTDNTLPSQTHFVCSACCTCTLYPMTASYR